MRVINTGRDRAIAFRLGSHDLALKLPRGSLLKAAGACGVQNTPPGSAALSLHARVSGLTPADVNKAFEEDKALIQTFSLRGATYAFPTADAAVFTRGVLPEDEDSIRFFIQGAIPAFDKVGLSAIEAVRLTREALFEMLDGRAAVKSELAPGLADMVAERISPELRGIWKSTPSDIAGVAVGEAVVRFCLYVVALEGTFCFVTRHNAASYVRTDQWLGAPLPVSDAGKARAEIARRYLSCYGPSTAAHFSEWAGISCAQANATWKLIEEELAAVDLNGRGAWLLKRDLSRFNSPQAPEGVRFLPPHDPYLLLRDRETLIPDRALRRRIWRAVGNPGIVLLEGKPVAMWRPAKKGKRLNLALELFEAVPREARKKIEAEAATIALYKDCSSAVVEFKEL